MENARSHDVDTVGYRPDLYENWFKKILQDTTSLQDLSEEDKEILALIWQEDGTLESRGESWSWNSSQDRSTSLQSKLEGLRDAKSMSSVWSRTMPDVEGGMKKLMKDRAELRFRYSNLSGLLQVSDAEVRESDEYSIVKLLHDIALSYSGQIDRVLYQAPATEKPPEDVDNNLKLTHSNTSVSTKPFSFSHPAGSVTGSTQHQKVQKSVSDEMLYTKTPQVLDSEISHVHLNIDYTEYSTSSNDTSKKDSFYDS